MDQVSRLVPVLLASPTHRFRLAPSDVHSAPVDVQLSHGPTGSLVLGSSTRVHLHLRSLGTGSVSTGVHSSGGGLWTHLDLRQLLVVRRSVSSGIHEVGRGRRRAQHRTRAHLSPTLQRQLLVPYGRCTTHRPCYSSS